MPFRDIFTGNSGVLYTGFCTPQYCTIYWLVDGERSFKTVCYDSAEMASVVNNRTRLTDGLTFEIEYCVGEVKI